MRPSQHPVCRCQRTYNGIRNGSLSKCLILKILRSDTNVCSQWNVAFGTPPPASASSQSSPPLRPHPPGTNYDMRPTQDNIQPGYQLPNTSPQSSNIHGPPSQMPPSSTYGNAAPVYVTPTMWQEAVASSLPDGLKRRWDNNNPSMADQSMYKRAR